MLVIHRIKLNMFDQAHQMREFQCDRPVRLQRRFEAAVKSLTSGTCAYTLLPAIRSAWLPSATRRGKRHTENITLHGNAK